jgi:hypothetical protein
MVGPIELLGTFVGFSETLPVGGTRVGYFLVALAAVRVAFDVDEPIVPNYVLPEA